MQAPATLPLSPDNRSLASIRREIRSRWPEILRSAGTRPARLPQIPELLGSSGKVEKGATVGVLTAVVYMSPGAESGRDMCPWATPACRAGCLGHNSGRLAFSPARNARLWKTALYWGDRALWRELLDAEIRSHAARARRQGTIAAVRVDGSTDTGEGALAALRHPDVTFYDYTKDPDRARAAARGEFGDNYRAVPFSYSGRNRAEAIEILRAGGKVAVVFDADPRKAEPLPERLWGFRVLDGDVTDARFLDPAGARVVALRFKAARKRTARLRHAIREGFVVRVAECGALQIAA